MLLKVLLIVSVQRLDEELQRQRTKNSQVVFFPCCVLDTLDWQLLLEIPSLLCIKQHLATYMLQGIEYDQIEMISYLPFVNGHIYG